MSARRIGTMIFVNIIVSAVVVLAILYWWDTRQSGQDVAADSVPIVLPTALPPTAVAEAAPTETPTPEPDPDEPLVHIVAAGDTLSNISRFYDVPLDDIVAANTLLNPNALAVGQEVIIPVVADQSGDAVVAAATATTDPAARPSPVATEPPAAGDVNVQIGEVVGAGQLATEAVQIINSGAGQIGLQDWTVQSESGRVYTFGQVTLFGEGAGILLHTEAGADGATDLYWGLEAPVWQSGETVTLRDADGEVQAAFLVP